MTGIIGCIIHGNKENLFTIIENGNNTAISNSFQSNMQLLVENQQIKPLKKLLTTT